MALLTCQSFLAQSAVAQAVEKIASAAPAQRWDVLTGDVLLSKTLQRWADKAGYRIKWDAARNFQIAAPTVFEGDFESAVADVLATPGIRMSDYPLEACIYANTPPLVRITRQGEQARECTAVTPLVSAKK